MLSHLRATSENRKLGRWIQPLVQRLSNGENLIQSMRATPAVPRRIAAMLELGAKSGDLGAAREQLTAWYDVMLQTSARTFQYRAMVLLYVVLMAVVGAMLIAVYVPIFGLAAVV
jgi:type IV pilus assembly protein PilC